MGFESDKQGIEFAASSKPLKPSSNVSDIVSKFAKACKFRSIGVFSTSENPDQGHIYKIISRDNATLLDEENSNAMEDAAFDAMKVYLQPIDVRKNGNICGHVEILKLFDTLLALKLAYVKLQEAHLPYDPEKIRAADEEVVSLLDSLCKIKKAYKEKLLKEANSVSACSALLLAEIQVKEKALEKLKLQAKSKDKEVANLQRHLQELEMRNKKLAEEIRERERESFKGLNHCSFENVVKVVGKAIHDFAKPLIALMKLSDWDLDQAANAIQASVVYAKRTKYLLVIHPKMEESFFGNLDHRNLVANGVHPHTPFYRAFVRMARCVWYLQGFTAFVEPKAEMFGVKQGSEFSEVYMEVLEELKEYKAWFDRGQERYKVEFMVMPGFKLGETLSRSQVYVSSVVSTNVTH
ncbi:UNVERIFIED_CONTAM: protein GRAVITROPIC IN THE LIGHT 1 [Sesamum calycinum]|uniref:Protein GRAVITROPIC IN THE LIGHT 1 n=1 Tax=Sesamum calycinum TaxID=2727403 RepID=A0AAW2S972_9LAMI